MKQVQLNLTVKALIYNTTKAYYKCSLGNGLCSLKLFLLRHNAAVLTSPALQQVKDCHLLIFQSFNASNILFFLKPLLHFEGLVLESTNWTVIVVLFSLNSK